MKSKDLEPAEQFTCRPSEAAREAIGRYRKAELERTGSLMSVQASINELIVIGQRATVNASSTTQDAQS